MNRFVLNNRQQKIIDLLTKNNAMAIKELSEKLSVSTVTIRRDLDYLGGLDYVTKFHGSVMLVNPKNPQTLFSLSLETNKKAKNALAKAAVSLIKPKDIISIDSGSTTHIIADHIPSNYFLKIITNSLITAMKFAQNPQNEVIQVGGLLHFDTSSTTDFLATEFLHKFKTDIAFITANAFQMPFGAYDRIVSLIELKRAFISITNRVVLMIDSSKFGQQSMYLSVPIENAHTIITDEKAPPETIKQISDTGKEILIVETDTCNIIKRYNSID